MRRTGARATARLWNIPASQGYRCRAATQQEVTQEDSMTIEVNGKVLEMTPTGFLVNQEDWNEDVAKVLAKNDQLELTDRHWDVLRFLREEFFNNNGNQPN